MLLQEHLWRAIHSFSRLSRWQTTAARRQFFRSKTMKNAEGTPFFKSEIESRKIKMGKKNSKKKLDVMSAPTNKPQCPWLPYIRKLLPLKRKIIKFFTESKKNHKLTKLCILHTMYTIFASIFLPKEW